MASTLPFLLVLLLLSTCSSALSPPKRTTLLLQVSKKSNQYVALLRQGTPSTLLDLVVDLGARYSWVDCEKNPNSSTFSYVPCKSRDCAAALSKSCSVPRNVCGTFVSNPYIKTSGPGDLAQDAVSIQTTDGTTPGRPITVPNVTFSCGPKSLLEGLPDLSAGMLGLGRTGVALPSQLASSLRYANKFALCLADHPYGIMFFGDGPYRFIHNRYPAYQEFSSSSFVYTPLLTNPVSTAPVSFAGEPSVEYFVNVKAVKVKGKIVPVKSSLLSINRKGKGGTKLSTVDPYTVLESSIYKAVVDAFARESGLRRVKAVAPFGACFDGRKVTANQAGPAVPSIELVMDGGSWVWYGLSTMVGRPNRVLCLGLVDGGVNAETSIVVGGWQMQEHLLMFDLEKKRFGFRGALPLSQTSCSQFNFTYIP